MAATTTPLTLCGADNEWMRNWRSMAAEPVSSKFIHSTRESMNTRADLLSYDRADLPAQLRLIDEHARAIISALAESDTKDLSGAPIPIATARVQLGIIADDLDVIACAVRDILDTDDGKGRWGEDEAAREVLRRLIAPFGEYASDMRGYS